ncbi:hypothetical protein [Companilactobacillus muriivasis]|uniref:hypothetical protein n=1 Tax=Companilactobacillus muriivasis TaxID=3081444 RepID=UPI0030C68783
MPKIIKTDRSNFESHFNEFINDKNIKILLVRSYEHKDSIKETFSSLINNSNMNTGIIKVRAMKNNHVIFNGIMSEKELKKMHQDDIVGNDNLKVKFESKSYFEDVKNRYDFELFCPIESILFDVKETNKLKDVLKKASAKTILITTNDYGRKPEQLLDVVDEVLILDTTEERKNVEGFSILKQRIIDRDGKLPY